MSSSVDILPTDAAYFHAFVLPPNGERNAPESLDVPRNRIDNTSGNGSQIEIVGQDAANNGDIDEAQINSQPDFTTRNQSVKRSRPLKHAKWKPVRFASSETAEVQRRSEFYAAFAKRKNPEATTSQAVEAPVTASNALYVVPEDHPKSEQEEEATAHTIHKKKQIDLYRDESLSIGSPSDRMNFKLRHKRAAGPQRDKRNYNPETMEYSSRALHNTKTLTIQPSRTNNYGPPGSVDTSDFYGTGYDPPGSVRSSDSFDDNYGPPGFIDTSDSFGNGYGPPGSIDTSDSLYDIYGTRPLPVDSGVLPPPPVNSGVLSPPPVNSGVLSPPPVNSKVLSPLPVNSGVLPPPVNSGAVSSPPVNNDILPPLPVNSGIFSPSLVNSGVLSPAPVKYGINPPIPVDNGYAYSPGTNNIVVLQPPPVMGNEVRPPAPHDYDVHPPSYNAADSKTPSYLDDLGLPNIDPAYGNDYFDPYTGNIRSPDPAKIRAPCRNVLFGNCGSIEFTDRHPDTLNEMYNVLNYLKWFERNVPFVPQNVTNCTQAAPDKLSELKNKVAYDEWYKRPNVEEHQKQMAEQEIITGKIDENSPEKFGKHTEGERDEIYIKQSVGIIAEIQKSKKNMLKVA